MFEKEINEIVSKTASKYGITPDEIWDAHERLARAGRNEAITKIYFKLKKYLTQKDLAKRFNLTQVSIGRIIREADNDGKTNRRNK